MIKKLDISGVHMTVGADLKRHVLKKIGHLDTYIPRRARAAVHAEVRLKEGKAKNKEERICEVVLHLPNENITIAEKAANIFTAVNAAGEKLKTQLHKYKELQPGPRLKQHLLARLRRKRLPEPSV